MTVTVPAAGETAAFAREAALAVEPGQMRTRLYRADGPPRDADISQWPELCLDDENLLWVDLTDP